MGIGRLIALIEPQNGASERVAVKIGIRVEQEVIRPGGEARTVYAVEIGDLNHFVGVLGLPENHATHVPSCGPGGETTR